MSRHQQEVSHMVDKPLDGRVVVISGAGSGLGLAHALTLGRLGASVAAVDLPAGGTVSGAERTAAQVEAAGGTAVPVSVSVTDPGAGQEIVDTVIEAFGRVDMVLNNAGILRDGGLVSRSRQDWDAVIDVHVNGSYELTKAAWPHMVEQGFGRVVVTSSAAGLFGTANNASYGAAKLGVVGLAKMLAAEGQQHGINVNAIAPLAQTPMSSSAGDRDRAADVIGDLFARMAPEQVSETVAWLLHPECDVTGRILSIGGGRVAEVFIAETHGWTQLHHSWQDVRDHWCEITTRDGRLHEPRHLSEEMALFQAALTIS